MGKLQMDELYKCHVKWIFANFINYRELKKMCTIYDMFWLKNISKLKQN